MNYREEISEINPEAMAADGFDDAIIGIAYSIGNEPLLAYSVNKIIEILMREEMTEEEAREYYDYNIVGAYVGPGTPVFVEE